MQKFLYREVATSIGIPLRLTSGLSFCLAYNGFMAHMEFKSNRGQ